MTTLIVPKRRRARPPLSNIFLDVLTYLKALLPLSPLIAAIALVWFAPDLRPDAEARGTRMLSDNVGYKPAVDALAKLDLLKIVVKPRRGSLPERSTIEIDRAQLAKLSLKGDGAITSESPILGDCRAYADRENGIYQRIRQRLSGKRDKNPALSACVALIKDYQQNSFLRDDMIWASTDIWQIKNNKISEIRPESHTLRESGLNVLTWRDNLLYAPESPEPKNRASVVLPTDQKIRTYVYDDDRLGLTKPRWRLAAGRSYAMINPFAEPRPEDRSDTLYRQSRTGTNALIYHWLDRGLLIEAPARYSGPELFVNGRWTLSGSNPTLTGKRLIPVAASQVIGFRDPRLGRVETWQLTQRPDNLSQLAPSGQRVHDPRFAILAMQAEANLVRGDLTTSVLRRPQLWAQKILEAQLEQVALQEPRTIRGGIFMMDGMTGEVTAAASFPARPEHLARNERNAASRREWLQLNMNFQPLPMGSVTKVPFAAAVALTYPKVLDWDIEFIAKRCIDFSAFTKDGDAAMIKGDKCPSGWVSTETKSNGGEKTVNFNRFITYSNNYFALRLLRYATAMSANRPAGSSHWASKLGRLACIDPFAGRGLALSASDCPMHIWRDEENLTRGVALTPLMLSLDKLPRREQYGNFYLWTLGGGDGGRWTNANLAQAYARLIGGRAVAPRLTAVNGEGSGTAPQLPEKIKLGSNYPQVWKNVMNGMANVITKGTARTEFAEIIVPIHDKALGSGTTLASKADADDVIYAQLANGKAFLFGKTGTPTVLEKDPSGDGSLFVLAAARTFGDNLPRDVKHVCGLRIIVVNLQSKASGKAAAVASELLKTEAIRKWIDEACPARNDVK